MLSINPQNFLTGKNHFLLSNDENKIEVATTSPKQHGKNKVIVICHPHPLYGGTMENKVVTTLMRTFNELDFKTVRFNFRGVGASTGEHASGIGETEDLLELLAWVHQVLPYDEIWLAGFSFGAYVAYRVATLSDYKRLIKGLILIAPPVIYSEFAMLPEPTMPWWVVQGEADELIYPKKVFAWLNTKINAPHLIRMSATSHFFHGKLTELKNKLIKVFQ